MAENSPSQSTAVGSDALALHLKEIEYLRKEIEYRTLAQRDVERHVIIAVSAIYAALATLDVSQLSPPLKGLGIHFLDYTTFYFDWRSRQIFR